VFNLINNINVKETNEKIEKWRIENQALIAANIAKQVFFIIYIILIKIICICNIINFILYVN